MLRIGHRGAAGYEPENTLRSFRKAINLGVDMIEFDVRLCKSGDLVVFHDESLERITGTKKLIRNSTLVELKKYDVGKGEKIPTLIEALDLIGREVAVNIEMKGENVAEPTAVVIKKYIEEKKWPPELFLASSFNRKELARFVKINPGARLGILVGKNPFDAVARAILYKAYSVHIHHHFLWRWLVRAIQRGGFKVFAFWLPNEKWEKKAKKIRVDGIFSDYPDKI